MTAWIEKYLWKKKSISSDEINITNILYMIQQKNV